MTSTVFVPTTTIASTWLNDVNELTYEFLQPDTGAVARTGVDKLQDVLSVKDFGAVGDGVTDDTAAIQAAVNAANNIIFPTGTYKITSSITVPSNRTIDCQANVTFDVSTAPTGTRVFNASGTFGTGYLLSANAVAGATSLTLSSGDASNFAAGDWIQIYSNTIYDTGYANAKIGEAVQIDSVSSGTITLKSPLDGGTYTTAASASIRKITFVENINIVGGYFIGSSTSTVIHTAVRFEAAYNCKVVGSKAKYCNSTAFWFLSSLFCTVSQVYVEDALDSNSGYGVNWSDTCQDCKTIDSSFLRCRHAVTNTSSAGGFGLNRRLSYENLTSYNTINNGDAFDTHSNAEDVAFVNCVSYDASASGFNIECGTAMLTGCKAIRSNRNGIAFSTNITLTPNRFTATGCVVDTTNLFYGIQVANGSTTSNSATQQISIVGCSVYNTTEEAFLADGDSGAEIHGLEVTGGQYNGNDISKQFSIGAYVSKFRVSNVHVQAPNTTGSAMLLQDCSYGSVDNCIIEFTTQGTARCLNLTDVNNITISNCTGKQVNPTRGTGIYTSGTNTEVYIATNNNFLDCSDGGTFSTTQTIASGEVTLPHGGDMFLNLDTEGGAASDELDTINNGVPGQVIVLQQVESARDIVVKDTTGNIRSAGDFTMTDVQDSLTLKYNGQAWIEMGRADIA